MGRLIALLLVVLALAPAALAEVRVRAELGTPTAYAGEAVALIVTVEGAKDAAEPAVVPVDGLSIRYRGGQDISQTTRFEINGRVTVEEFKGYRFAFEVVGLREGRFVIPAMSVRVGNETLTTRPLAFRVLEPQEDEDIVLRLSTDRTSVFVGEPIALRVTLGLGKSVNSARFTLPGVEGVFEVVTPSTPASRRGEVVFSLLDRDIPASRGTITHNGAEITAYTAELVIIPRRDGEFTIGPATAACEVLVSERRTIWDRDVTRRAVVPSNAVTLNAKPLPTEGRPSNFNGLVGRYLVSSSANRTEVNVGDPIRLTITVRGPLPGAVPAPDLERQPDLAGNFRVGSDQPRGVVEDGRVRFERELRALRDDVREIPAIELPYFNVETGRYEVARSEAIPLTVRPTRTITAADGVGVVEAPAHGGAELESNAEGIRHNFTGPEALADQRFALRDAVLSPVGVGAIVAPPALYAGVSVFMLARRKSTNGSAARRRQRALASARAVLRERSETGAAGAVGHALRTYAGHRFGRSPDGLTIGECADLLAGAGPELQERVRDLLTRCDAAVYGGGASGDAGERLVAEASSLLGELDRALNRGRS